MNTSILKSTACAALLALATLGAQAQELKIGYVNADKVLREAAPAKAAPAAKKAAPAKAAPAKAAPAAKKAAPAKAAKKA